MRIVSFINPNPRSRLTDLEIDFVNSLAMEFNNFSMASIFAASALSHKDFSSVDRSPQTYNLPSDEIFFNAMTSISADDRSALALTQNNFNLPSDESFFNALVHQTSDVETFGSNNNGGALNTLLEQRTWDKNEELHDQGSCIDMVEMDMLLGGADLSLQLLSLQDFLRVLSSTDPHGFA